MELATDQIATPVVMAGENLILSVSISGFNVPLTSISWTQQGNTLTGSNNRVTITNNPMLSAISGPVSSTLMLSSVIPTDSGTYSATATNGAGNGTVMFTVTVQGKKRN